VERESASFWSGGNTSQNSGREHHTERAEREGKKGILHTDDELHGECRIGGEEKKGRGGGGGGWGLLR